MAMQVNFVPSTSACYLWAAAGGLRPSHGHSLRVLTPGSFAGTERPYDQGRQLCSCLHRLLSARVKAGPIFCCHQISLMSEQVSAVLSLQTQPCRETADVSRILLDRACLMRMMRMMTKLLSDTHRTERVPTTSS